MAKLTKKVIKSIVKECLVEILSEGIGQSSLVDSDIENRAIHEKSLSESVDERKKTAYRRRIGLDKIEYGKQESKNTSFQKNIQEATKSITSDPVLSSILADTAMTTLQEQLGAESSGPGGRSIPTAMAGDGAARMVAQSSPEDIFGESASKWAELAFADKVN